MRSVLLDSPAGAKAPDALALASALCERTGAELIPAPAASRPVDLIVSERLPAEAPAALALAPPGLAARGVALERIAVGHDGSRESALALTLAGQLARKLGASLTIVGVVEPSPGLAPELEETGGGGSRRPSPAAGAGRRPRRHRRQLAAAQGAGGVGAARGRRRGRPARPRLPLAVRLDPADASRARRRRHRPQLPAPDAVRDGLTRNYVLIRGRLAGAPTAAGERSPAGSTWVPASPRTMRSASARAPTAARRPVASTKRQAASTFGPIEPAAKSSAAQLVGAWRGAAAARPSVAPVEADRVDVGQHQQQVGVEAAGQQRRGQVLVDHRLDAAHRAGAVEGDGDAAAAGADQQRAALDQDPQAPQLGDRVRLRRGDEAAEGVAVGADRPAALGGEAARLARRGRPGRSASTGWGRRGRRG